MLMSGIYHPLLKHLFLENFPCHQKAIKNLQDPQDEEWERERVLAEFLSLVNFLSAIVDEVRQVNSISAERINCLMNRIRQSLKSNTEESLSRDSGNFKHYLMDITLSFFSTSEYLSRNELVSNLSFSLKDQDNIHLIVCMLPLLSFHWLIIGLAEASYESYYLS